jgi:glycosyltransferase involved in cell wall biosynthesis
LRTFLACLVDQTYDSWECVVTDNSDDPAAIEQQRELCKIDPRIRYEHTGERAWDSRIGIRSLYTAAEIGIAMTTGEYLWTPNDDDYFAPWFLERLMAKADEELLEFVYCDIVIGRPDIAHYALNTAPVGCGIDKCCFLFKREWMPAEWPGKLDQYGVADGVLVNDLVARGIKHGKVPQLLAYHN